MNTEAQIALLSGKSFRASCQHVLHSFGLKGAQCRNAKTVENPPKFRGQDPELRLAILLWNYSELSKRLNENTTFSRIFKVDLYWCECNHWNRYTNDQSVLPIPPALSPILLFRKFPLSPLLSFSFFCFLFTWTITFFSWLYILIFHVYLSLYRYVHCRARRPFILSKWTDWVCVILHIITLRNSRLE